MKDVIYNQVLVFVYRAASYAFTNTQLHPGRKSGH